MKKVGISERDIFMDKQSGKDFERALCQLLKRIIRKRYVLFIHSLNRFCRKFDVTVALLSFEHIFKGIKSSNIHNKRWLSGGNNN